MPRLWSGFASLRRGFRSYRSRVMAGRRCALPWRPPGFSTADMAKKKDPDHRVVADNRKARHLYFIESTLEAGLMPLGREGKNFGSGESKMAQTYAHRKGGGTFSVYSHIPQNKTANS